MTPEQHNKYLAWSHIAYGGIFFLFTLIFLLLFGGIFIASLMNAPDAPPLIIFFFMFLFMAAIYAAMSLPSIIAGYALLKRKKWARTWAIISAVVAAMQFPLGTAVTVYTFWFLFSDPGKQFFEQGQYALPPGRQTWANDTYNYDASRQRENQYHPPQPPPDWR
ncbi:MAG TPA: hypothetical protein VFS76_05240 [Pyrinomonadaceae bacterium]|nr:hypothetical protein [Pyrinomonadaceae bacterium]